MSSDVRTVPVARFEIEALDKAIRALYREHDNESATRLGALLLRWQSLGTPVFACDDIDESAGLAEVVELRGYSRKVPPVGCGA